MSIFRGSSHPPIFIFVFLNSPSTLFYSLFDFPVQPLRRSQSPHVSQTPLVLQYDPEGFGEIPWDDFVEVLKTPEFVEEVTPNKRDILADRAQDRKTSAITFQDFVNVVSTIPLPSDYLQIPSFLQN